MTLHLQVIHSQKPVSPRWGSRLIFYVSQPFRAGLTHFAPTALDHGRGSCVVLSLRGGSWLPSYLVNRATAIETRHIASPCSRFEARLAIASVGNYLNQDCVLQAGVFFCYRVGHLNFQQMLRDGTDFGAALNNLRRGTERNAVQPEAEVHFRNSERR